MILKVESSVQNLPYIVRGGCGGYYRLQANAEIGLGRRTLCAEYHFLRRLSRSWVKVAVLEREALGAGDGVKSFKEAV